MRISFPLAKIPKSESAISERNEAKIFNGYVFDDGIEKCVTKRVGRTEYAPQGDGDVTFSPFHDSEGNVWWFRGDDLNIWKNTAIAHVQDTGFLTAGDVVDNSGVGTISWSTPRSAASSDNAYAAASLDDEDVSHYLLADNFSVSIPSGATVTGVEVKVEKSYIEDRETGFSNFSSFSITGGTGGNVNGSTNTWIDASNAQTSNDTYMVGNFGISGVGNAGIHFTNTARATNPSSIDIPPNAIITGIEVRIEKVHIDVDQSGSTITDTLVQLIVGGTQEGSNLNAGTWNKVSGPIAENDASEWPAGDGDTVTVYGGEGETWGLTLTGADINSNFGVAFRAQLNATESFDTEQHDARVDHIQVKFYYRIPEAPRDNSIKLVKGGVISGNDLANIVDAWSTSDDETNYGGPNTLWGLSLTESDVESSDFGVVFSVESNNDNTIARVDSIQLKVFYETTTGTTLSNLYTTNGISWAEDNEYIYLHGGGPESGTNSDYYIRKDLIDSSTIIEITDADHPIKMATPDESPPGVVALHGYFFIIGNHKAANSMDSSYSRIYNSDLGAPGTWTGTNFIASASPGFLRYIAEHKEHIVAFGQASMDFYYDAGNPTGSPLSLRQDINYKVGLVDQTQDDLSLGDNSHSGVITYGNDIFFLGRPHRGGIGIYVLTNFQLQKVSTPSIDNQLNGDGTSVIRGILSFNNKDFLLVQPDYSSAITWVFDLQEKQWYEWNVNYNRGVSGNKIAIDGSASLWQASGIKDAGNDFELFINLPKINQIPNISTNTRGLPKFCREVTIEADIPGSETLIEVSFSDNDYQSFSTARTLDINNKDRKLTRFGNFRERAFKLSYTGSNNIKLYSFDVDIDVGMR